MLKGENVFVSRASTTKSLFHNDKIFIPILTVFILSFQNK